MQRNRIEFDEAGAYALARQYFLKTCHFDLSKPKHVKMYEAGVQARESGLDGIQIRANYSSCDGTAFCQNTVTVDGKKFFCPAFSQIKESSVKKIYFYIFSAGECHYEDDDPITKQLLADIWGSSYADAAFDMFQDWLRGTVIPGEFPGEPGKMLKLSPPFGPGYFGMENQAALDLCELLGAEEIGVEVRKSGVMVPLKTCVGMFFLLDGDAELPAARCKACQGNAGGCEFCRVRMQNGASGQAFPPEK